MVKKISVSFTDWVFTEYLAGIKSNRSKFIEEMLVKGIKTETGEYTTNAAKQVELIKEIRNKDEEIAKLKTRLGRAELLSNKDDPELEAKTRIADAIKASNVLGRDRP